MRAGSGDFGASSGIEYGSTTVDPDQLAKDRIRTAPYILGCVNDVSGEHWLTYVYDRKSYILYKLESHKHFTDSDIPLTRVDGNDALD